MSRATADIDMIANFLQSGFTHVTRSTVWFAAVAVIMLATNWRLGIIRMSFLPLSVWILGALVMRIEAAWARVQRDTGRMTSVLQESVTGKRLVQAFGASRHEERRFEVAAGDALPARVPGPAGVTPPYPRCSITCSSLPWG